jgi:hypothetical protein
VISTKLYAGRTVAHVYCDSTPGTAFEPARPDLEDVYFSAVTAASAGDASTRARREDLEVPGDL